MHGGDVLGVAAAFGVDPATLIDFSANINPLGPSQNVRDAIASAAVDISSVTRYPQPHAPVLTQKIAARYGIDRSSIVIGHGTAGLLHAVMRAFRPRTMLVPIPAFSEYSHACAATGCELLPYPLCQKNDFHLDTAAFIACMLRERPDMVLINTPHNPSGSLVNRRDVLAIADAANAIGAVTLIDEAFIDYISEESVLREASAKESIVVLRSFTKFYAFPSLRVGYAVASINNARRIERMLPSWPVSTIALIAAEAAVDDFEFEQRSLEHNTNERARLTETLASTTLRVIPSAANYLLLDCKMLGVTSAVLRNQLITNHAIIVRDCGDYASFTNEAFIRIAIRTNAENNHLLAALRLLEPAR